MFDIPEWVQGYSIFAVSVVAVYLFQRTRRGIRIMTSQGLKDQLAAHINDELWAKFEKGKLSGREFILWSDRLAELLDLTQLKIRDQKKLKLEIKRRLKNGTHKSTHIPGERPPQDNKSHLVSVRKKLRSFALKLNGTKAA